jgi:Tfp pilus assembly ATPase PilU
VETWTEALKFMHELLRLMTQKKGSDLFITPNFPPAIKIDGKVYAGFQPAPAAAALRRNSRARS